MVVGNHSIVWEGVIVDEDENFSNVSEYICNRGGMFKKVIHFRIIDYNDVDYTGFLQR